MLVKGAIGSSTTDIACCHCFLFRWKCCTSKNKFFNNLADVIVCLTNIIVAMASQISSLAIVPSTVYAGADQRTQQSFASLAFVRGIHWWPSEPIRLWSWPVDFPPFGVILIQRNGTKLGVSGHFSENAWRDWLEILHADVSCPPSKLFRLWSRSVEFPSFGATLT